ncbi:MAG: FkbM family methyltransferase [Flavobacterium sp.]
MIQSEINGIKFYYRENTSDLKTFEEVIGRDVYRKKGMTIKSGEKWIDCGGNVGAFTLLACSLGAKVTVYEPDPNNCKMIEKNLKLNNFEAEIVCAGLVHNETKKANLYVGNNGNVWRNSMFKNWNGKGLKVDCVNFDEVIEDGVCVKMDIEGAEMPILENTNRKFKKLVFEWSFDIDPSLPRFWNIIDKLNKDYKIASIGNTAKYESRDYDVWQKSWFPACTNVFCYEKD